MGRHVSSQNRVLALLVDGKPRCSRDVARLLGLSGGAAVNVLKRCWVKGLVLRTKETIYESERIFKGRAGVTRTTRPYHLYILRSEYVDSVKVDGYEFVNYDEKYLDVRGGGRGRKSKAQKILDFLEKNRDRAWFSKEIAEDLKTGGVMVRDIMSNVRRFEAKGLVYVRGYKLEDKQTPFKEGYLITWIGSDKPRKQAIDEAVQRTNIALEEKRHSSPLIERVHRIIDIILEHSKLRRLVAFSYIQNKLGSTKYEAEHAVSRALQLYPEFKAIKLFNAYRYYYHTSISENDLRAAIAMKENFIRLTKGRANRVGHNWEAVAEWFIDKFTTGARFWTQTHRTKRMDPRRITLHLIKAVGGRRTAAEVDRVWEVTPGVFVPPTTYVLSCKWGLVNKRDVDDFLDVLRWSKGFGVDTPERRQVKQGVIGVFAASAFNPKENVKLKDETVISLASYVARMNIQLLKAADFNSKLRDRGCAKQVTVQKICRIATDEGEVREVLDDIWTKPAKSEEILAKVAEKNKELYEFERMLEKRE